MVQRLLTIWQGVRESLWALPLAMVCVAAAAALVAAHIRLGQGGDAVWWLYSGGSKQAPQFLSNLVSAMITMATLVISITMVVLTLAAQQLGPRLIRSFMDDRATQLSLGLFIATVVYLLLVLRSTYGTEDDTPNLAVTIGTALVLTSVIVLPLFVHHLARSIIVDNVIQRIGAMLDERIEELLPERTEAPQPRPPASIRDRGRPLRLGGSGYVQAIDFARLSRCAAAADAVIELAVRAGHYVLAGRTIGWIAGGGREDETQRELAAAVLLGREPTPIQDLEFAMRQLVEVAVRALSPGVNDPFSAITAVDRLAQSLARAMCRGPARTVWEDDDGRIRVIAPSSTFEGLADLSFNQIRQHAEGTPSVLIRLADRMVALRETADAAQRMVIEKHLRLVLDAGERSIKEGADLQALRARASQAACSPGRFAD